MASMEAIGAAVPLSRLRRQVRGVADRKVALSDNRRRRLWRAMAVPCEERLVLFDFDDEEDDLNVSKNSLSEEKSPFFDKDEKKRPPVADTDEKKCPPAVDADEKRSPPAAEEEKKCPPAEVDEAMGLKVNNKHYQQFMDLFKQWELENQNYEKQQKHLLNILQEQKMLLRQYRIKQNQRMKLIMQMYAQYIQDNNNIFTASLIELKEEIAEYQRKYMMETQLQEIANIRKSLQSILFS